MRRVRGRWSSGASDSGISRVSLPNAAVDKFDVFVVIADVNNACVTLCRCFRRDLSGLFIFLKIFRTRLLVGEYRGEGRFDGVFL